MGVDILVNGRSLTRRVTGIERYTREVLNCLGEQVRIIQPAGTRQSFVGHAWEQFVLPGLISPKTVLWSPANTGPLAVTNQVLTIHDLSPLEHPEWFKPAFAAWYRLFLPLLARRVKRVITPSTYIQRKVVSRFHLPENRIVAIPEGVNLEQFCRQPKTGQYGRYILYVGTIEPRKNLATLLAAWKRIEMQHPDVSLVIAGVPGTVFRQCHFPKNVERLRLAGYIPEEALPALYSNADIFVLPSFEEGFGLPVLEAMACGTPVVASTGGALPEVAGESALFFHPRDSTALAEILSQCLSNSNLRRSMSERGRVRALQFSWKTTTDRIWQTLQGIYET